MAAYARFAISGPRSFTWSRLVRRFLRRRSSSFAGNAGRSAMSANSASALSSCAVGVWSCSVVASQPLPVEILDAQERFLVRDLERVARRRAFLEERRRESGRPEPCRVVGFAAALHHEHEIGERELVLLDDHETQPVRQLARDDVGQRQCLGRTEHRRLASDRPTPIRLTARRVRGRHGRLL